MVLKIQEQRFRIARRVYQRQEVNSVSDRALEVELDAGAQMRLQQDLTLVPGFDSDLLLRKLMMKAIILLGLWLILNDLEVPPEAAKLKRYAGRRQKHSLIAELLPLREWP